MAKVTRTSRSVVFDGEEKRLRIHMLETSFGTFEVIVRKAEYLVGGGLALQVMDYDKDYGWEPFDDLTLNLFEHPCEEGCAFIKNYSENSEWADALARAIGGVPTGRTARTRFVEVPEYDFTGLNI